MSCAGIEQPYLIALVPAYCPSPLLLNTVQALKASHYFYRIIVVDDGSGSEYDHIFSSLENFGCIIIRHMTNLGKGMALKSGLNYAGVHYKNAIGIITFDADGQHQVNNIISVGNALIAYKNRLILGSRLFDCKAPLRSKFGNYITRLVFSFITGIHIKDTQTGLRGIPMDLVPDLLRITNTGYDFELDMLLLCTNNNILLHEVTIDTIYIENNESSHFNPFLDSMKIYMVFMRFSISSLLTAFIDYCIFCLCINYNMGILSSIFCGRILAGIFNFSTNKYFVFKSKRKLLTSATMYTLLVVLSGFISWVIIDKIMSNININIYLSKILAEIILYFINFIIQRDIIFNYRKGKINETN